MFIVRCFFCKYFIFKLLIDLLYFLVSLVCTGLTYIKSILLIVDFPEPSIPSNTINLAFFIVIFLILTTVVLLVKLL